MVTELQLISPNESGAGFFAIAIYLRKMRYSALLKIMRTVIMHKGQKMGNKTRTNFLPFRKRFDVSLDG